MHCKPQTQRLQREMQRLQALKASLLASGPNTRENSPRRWEPSLSLASTVDYGKDGMREEAAEEEELFASIITTYGHLTLDSTPY